MLGHPIAVILPGPGGGDAAGLCLDWDFSWFSGHTADITGNIPVITSLESSSYSAPWM